MTIQEKKLLIKGQLQEIVIGSDIWIGASYCLSGVKINNRVVIGAGSVVTSNLESGYLYAGVQLKNTKIKLKNFNVKGFIYSQ